ILDRARERYKGVTSSRLLNGVALEQRRADAVTADITLVAAVVDHDRVGAAVDAEGVVEVALDGVVLDLCQWTAIEGDRGRHLPGVARIFEQVVEDVGRVASDEAEIASVEETIAYHITALSRLGA